MIPGASARYSLNASSKISAAATEQATKQAGGSEPHGLVAPIRGAESHCRAGQRRYLPVGRRRVAGTIVSGYERWQPERIRTCVVGAANGTARLNRTRRGGSAHRGAPRTCPLAPLGDFVYPIAQHYHRLTSEMGIGGRHAHSAWRSPHPAPARYFQFGPHLDRYGPNRIPLAILRRTSGRWLVFAAEYLHAVSGNVSMVDQLSAVAVCPGQRQPIVRGATAGTCHRQPRPVSQRLARYAPE